MLSKRNGSKECFLLDKLTSRLTKLSYFLDVDIGHLTRQVVISENMSSVALDEHVTDICLSTRDSDLSVLAKRILVSNIHRNTDKHFNYANQEINSAIIHHRDNLFTFEELTKLRRNYDEIRPQHLIMRQAIDIHGEENTTDVIKEYNTMSQNIDVFFTHI
jgi:ribonucleoside-diphosphate reductase subunit M1